MGAWLPKHHSVNRKFFFWLILFILIFVPLLALEGFVRVFGPTVLDDPYLNLGRLPTFVTEEQVDGQRTYRLTHPETYSKRNIVFPAEKRSKTFRIFCLGGSASAGWPHPASEIYSVYLQEALQRAFPEREIEVINASAHAYAAYRVRMIFEEVVNYEPDLIVLYSGNNEFVEQRTYFDNTGPLIPLLATANKLVTFRLVRGALARWLFPDNALSGGRRDDVSYSIWSKLEKFALHLRSDPLQFARLKAHYAYSIEAMVRKAQERHLPVILVTVPVNLRDWMPNVSYESLSGAEAAPWLEHLRAGRAALLRHNPEFAIRSFEQAIGLDPLHAGSHFYLARAYEQLESYENAIEHYDHARELDHNPFRALSAFNTTLRNLVSHFENAYVAEAEMAFRLASTPLAPGFDLLLDYVHPTKQGNLIIAQTVFNTIVAENLVGTPASVSQFTHVPTPDLNGNVYDELQDFYIQGRMLKLFVMMHQYNSIVEKAQYISNTPGAVDGLREKDARLMRAVLEVFPELLEIDRKQVLGIPLEQGESQRLDRQLKELYRAHFQGYKKLQSQNTTKS
jgi:tetratricopeptide (TPR) repeat protein